MSGSQARPAVDLDPRAIEPSARPLLNSCTVLVVDDFNTMRSIVSTLLRQLGAQRIVEAENGAQACAKLALGDIDLVVSDWNMPVMTGVDLLKQVRADEKTAHIPFLLVTAEARKENIVEAVRAGADGYIVKPFTANVLGEKIAAILSRGEALNGRRSDTSPAP